VAPAFERLRELPLVGRAMDWGMGPGVASRRTLRAGARIAGLRATESICPYCAVGCSQVVYTRGGELVDIEGNPRSPINQGTLCPKGAATRQLVQQPGRLTKVLYRRPRGTRWEELELETAMDMIAERVIRARERGWQDRDREERVVNRTLGFAHLGGATLDNEENYLIKKLFMAMGCVQIENQARICHSSTVPGLGNSFGRGGATDFLQDLQHSQCVLIQGSAMAEAHPVGFRWVMKAKERGAHVIHVDPRFSRTSQHADRHVAIRPGTDVAFLGGLIRHVIETDGYFRDYVVSYTNAPTLVDERFRDVEDLEGVFSGFDPATGTYDGSTWMYEGGGDVAVSPGMREHATQAFSEHTGAGMHLRDLESDETLQHPRCVFQVLKRHFSRYTPELVGQICGIPPRQVVEVADALIESSGRESTGAFCYAVGLTQHTVGVQMIRAAAILQLLLGNIGRPGGGIYALRGHATIQGSTDIPTLYDLLPGYLHAPRAQEDPETLAHYLSSEMPHRGWWANADRYVVSLLKAWFGDGASRENDFGFGSLPKISGNHSHFATMMRALDGGLDGLFVMGQNPAVGSQNAGLQRRALASLRWLVVRDLVDMEAASFWRNSPEVESGELRPEEIETEVFLMPAASHVEKEGSFTNTQRLLQWRDKALEAPGDARSELWFMHHLARRVKDHYAGSDRQEDWPVRNLVWDYPEHGELREPDVDAVLKEINGYEVASGAPVGGFDELRADGSTACGCWIYSGVFRDGVNQARRREPGDLDAEGGWVSPEWGWSWPANRRLLYNRASADPDGQPWSERKRYIWWDESDGRWTGYDVPDFPLEKPPGYSAPPDALGMDAIAGDDPFIMMADGRGWLFAPSGLLDGPLPTHYEPIEAPGPNLLYPKLGSSPAAIRWLRPENPYHPTGDPRFPVVATTFRLTEHYTAGMMTRPLPWLAELQPEMFAEIDPVLAADRGIEDGGWMTISTERAEIEARALVTDRLRPVNADGRGLLHRIAMPWHWGYSGPVVGDSANDLVALAGDPNVTIHESRAFTCQVRAGRRAAPSTVRLAGRHAPWRTAPNEDDPHAENPKEAEAG
jgi:formate dehydrogenase major subunit